MNIQRKIFRRIFLFVMVVSLLPFAAWDASAQSHPQASFYKTLSASSPTVLVDWDGAPLCILDEKSEAFLALQWTGDLYERKVYALYRPYRIGHRYHDISIDDSYTYSEDVFRSHCANYRRRFLSEEIPAENLWPPRQSERRLPNDYHTHARVLVDAQTTEAFGIKIPMEIQVLLHQVRRGASRMLPPSIKNATDFIQHYTTPFDVDFNRMLASRYGAGFSSEIYEAWENAKPRNQDFHSQVLRNAEVVRMSPGNFLAKDFAKREVILVKGLTHELKAFDTRYAPILKELEDLGIPLRAVDAHSFNSIAVNGQLVQNEIEKTLAQGKNVILMSLSKGAPEVLWALSHFYQNWHGVGGPPSQWGHIEASITFSGVLNKSFVVEYVSSNFIKWYFAKSGLVKEYAKEGLLLNHFDGFLELGNDFIPTLLQKVEKQVQDGIFDQNLVWVHVVGAMGGNGLAGDKYMLRLQNGVIRARMGRGFGANDACLESPGNTIPDHWSKNKFVLVMKASHSVIDGKLGELNYQEPQARRPLLGSLFLSTLQRIQEGQR